jgi:Fic family protein
MKGKEWNIWKELELGFGGGSKFRVLTQLILNPKNAFTKYALAKATGLRTSTVDRQIKTLLELNWVVEHLFTPKTYQINLENDVVRHIRDFFLSIKHI